MMIKITERCTMGCKHCMNSATPDGNDMSMQCFKDSLEFLRSHNLGRVLIITGGEPTEHEHFDEFMKYFLDFSKEFRCFNAVTITTNGETISKESERFQEYVRQSSGVFELLFQVSADTRYYPRRIPTHKRIFREKGFILCDRCVEQIYPQGRALENNIPWTAKASKCFNVRALSKQVPNCTLADIEAMLALRGKFCTPHISVNGDIKLGESDLCPSCASIYDDYSIICDKIKNFKCHSCDHINNKLDDMYRQFL